MLICHCIASLRNKQITAADVLIPVTDVPELAKLVPIAHFASMGLNLASITFFSNNNHGVHNSNGVEAYMLKEALENKFMKTFNQKLIESLTIHSYDADISEKHIRIFDSTKLIDFIPLNFKNTGDYLKALD
ncbi:hypothetical protein RhiirA4_461494 [Rhizophagus irregularis]|uniref:Uncharacterized protein n=1 Tax=Rhizophagus irregularis TaxID=588596 RepID=A0A2I1GIZ7_9GLOM|nr:hypothetical protein RhiirA4_461494 [Rhizophagus irregularis]